MLASPFWANPPEATPGAPLASPVVSDIEAPTGAERLRVRWIRVTASGMGEMPAAVARPAGAGPFPTVVLLHGTHGFAREYVELAQAFAPKPAQPALTASGNEGACRLHRCDLFMGN